MLEAFQDILFRCWCEQALVKSDILTEDIQIGTTVR